MPHGRIIYVVYTVTIIENKKSEYRANESMKIYGGSREVCCVMRLKCFVPISHLQFTAPTAPIPILFGYMAKLYKIHRVERSKKKTHDRRRGIKHTKHFISVILGLR